MKYSINKYLLLEATQDVATLKSAHKTKVAEQYDSAIDTTHDTNKVERSKKLLTEAVATAAKPNHFQRNASTYGAGAGAVGALGAGYYSKEIADAAKNGYDKTSQYTQDTYNNSVLPAVKSGVKSVNDYIDSKKEDLNKFIDDQKANFAFYQKQKELGSLKTDESLTSNGLDPNAFRLRVVAGQATPDELRNFAKYNPKGFQQAGQDRVAQIRQEADDHAAAKKLADIEALAQKKEASFNAAQSKMNAARLLNKKFQDNQNNVSSVEHHD